MKAFIAAAGLGIRMRPLTETTPKALLPISGKPLIVHHLEQLQGIGIGEVFINSHWLAEQLHSALRDGSTWGLRIHWCHEPELLETGGTLAGLLPRLGAEPLLVLSADLYSDYPLKRLLSMAMDDSCDAHLVMVDNPHHHNQGDFAYAGGRLHIPVDTDRALTYSGIGLVRPRLVGDYPQRRKHFPLSEALRHAAAQGRLCGEHYRGLWCDVGTPQRLSELEHLLARVPRSVE